MRICMIVLFAASASAQIDPLLARIKLTKVEVITLRQFRNQLETLEKQLARPFSVAQRKQFLEALVDNKLLLQAADRDLIKVSQPEINKMLDAYKLSLGRRAGLNRKLTDGELEQLLKKENLTWEKLIDKFKEQIRVEKLVRDYNFNGVRCNATDQSSMHCSRFDIIVKCSFYYSAFTGYLC